MPIVSRGFRRRQPDPGPGVALPPGQHLVDGFPVLSAGPTPHVPLQAWDLAVEGAVGAPQRWTWEEFRALPGESITVDIHCVTSWSKLGTAWEGVSVDTLLADAEPAGGFLLAVCDGDYTTNLPLEDVTGGKAWVVHGYDGRPLEPEHGGPARLLVPHLYFWKSAKWVRRLVVLEREQLGFWEELGYHRRGDPWREQRYRDDF
jgi:DMSO/TMAO reductase YedYZ molybdopterin-dependent catalytic subunit